MGAAETIAIGVIAVFVTAALLLALGLVWMPWRRAKRDSQLAKAQREFHLQRERLEAKFFELAGSSGKPRGLRWTDCEFDNAVAYARDKKSGDISAFVAVTISFEAIEGGPMEDVEAVSNLRAGSAVFRYAERRWITEGRAMFNLNPAEAIAYYHERFELVGHEAGS